MMFKNSVKLLMANFSTVWKLLLYKIIVLCLVGGFFCATLKVLSNTPSAVIFFEQLKTFIMGFNVSTAGGILGDLNGLFSAFFAFVSELAVLNTFVFIYLIFLLLIVLPFLWKLADIPTGETLYGYMSSLTKYSFTGSFIRKLGTSCLYSLLNLAMFLPFNFIFAAGFYGIVILFSGGGLMTFILPAAIFVYFSAIIGLKMTFFSGWMPAIVVYNCGIIKGLKKGCTAVFRRFFKVLSSAAMICGIIVLINLTFGTFSFLITVPIGAMIVLIFQMVMFFGSQGMRYYVDLDTILSPKKLEETDKFKKIKNLI